MAPPWDDTATGGSRAVTPDVTQSTVMELLLLLFVFALFALPTIFLSRSNRKRLEQARQMQASVKPGDAIVTVSGFHGVIVAGTDTTVDLELAPGVVVTMEREGVLRPVEDQQENQENNAETDDIIDGDVAD